MKNPLVSVVIPVFNEAKYLPFCLSSLGEQSYTNKEIIVVDDGSTDNSIKICRKYNVQIVQQSHQGPGAARNKGVASAKGDILVFADADMAFDEKYIEKITEPIRKNRTKGTFNKEERVANKNNIWSRCWSINSGLPSDRRLPKSYPDQDRAFRAILKKTFIEAGGYAEDLGYGEDASLSQRTGIYAENAKGAISYHYNPESLGEVFYSARWIGRSSIFFKQNISNLLRYSIINSLRVSTKYIINQNAPFAIILFKVVYDAGMLVGIYFRRGQIYK